MSALQTIEPFMTRICKGRLAAPAAMPVTARGHSELESMNPDAAFIAAWQAFLSLYESGNGTWPVQLK